MEQRGRIEMTGNTILEVKEASISYVTRREKIDAVRKVSLTLEKGSITGLVGESGCGKSTLDVVVQSQITRKLESLRKNLGLSIL